MIYVKSRINIIGIMSITILSFSLLYCSLLEAPSDTGTYTVTFDMGGGTPIPAQQVISGETAIKPTIFTGITHGCYSAVENWYSDPEFNNQFSFSTPITSDITLYIKWDEATLNTDEEPKIINQIYQICNWKQLQWIAKDPARLAENYILASDIVFPNAGENDFPAWGFIPIGYDDNPNNDNNVDAHTGIPFSGTFDGNNKTISNLFINALHPNWISNGIFIPDTILDNDFIGLFGQIDRTEPGPAVKNLTIILAPGTQNAPSINANFYIGGLAGIITNGTVDNIAIKDGYIRGKSVIGGVVGRIEIGEVRGYNANTTLHTNNATISVGIGGLAGQLNKGTIIGYVTGNIIAPNGQNIGGLVGQSNGITIGYVTGSVSGNARVGGLVGQILNGSITGYITGTVTASFDVGGLAAYATNSDIVGYWDITATGRTTSIGGTYGISDTKNIIFNNGYVDTQDTPIAGDDVSIFDDSTFADQFDVTNGADATWPPLKTTVFSLPQPTVSDVDKDRIIEVTFPAE